VAPIAGVVAALVAAAVPARPAVDVLYLGPRCLDSGHREAEIVQGLYEHFDRHPGSSFVTSSGYSLLSDGSRLLFPEGDVTDGTIVRRFLAGLGRRPPSRTVIERRVPVLITPYEIAVQLPYAGHFDWLDVLVESSGGPPRFRDARRVTADVVRLTNARGEAVLSVELVPTATLSPDVRAYVRELALTARVAAPDDDTTILVAARQLGRGSRVRHELETLRGELSNPSLLLHPGGALDPRTSAAERTLCASALADLAVDAIVPRTRDLGLGVDALLAVVEQHDLPYVAANLRDRRPSGDARPDRAGRVFPRFVLRDFDGLSVAVIGIVAPDQLDGLPASARGRWAVDDPTTALEDTRDAIISQLGRVPDLTVVMVAGRPGTPTGLVQHRFVDVVIGEFPVDDLLPRRERISFLSDEARRERVRDPSPLLVARGSPVAIGRVHARFLRTTAGGYQLRNLQHQVRPVVEPGEMDVAYERALRDLEEREIAAASQLLLPDVGPVVEAHPSLEPLVWGDRIPHDGRFRRHLRPRPAQFTEPLWMRFVTGAMLQALDAEVALSRGMSRTLEMNGPLTRMFVDNWLRESDEIRVVSMSGRALTRLAEWLRAQDSAARIYAGGLDVEKAKVAGWPIVASERYRVATTDWVMEHPELRRLFPRREAVGRFLVDADGELEADEDDGHPVLVGDLVRRRIESWVDPATGRFDPVHLPAFEQLVVQDEDATEGRWRLDVDTLSLSGSSFRNAATDLGVFADTREARATTPDNFSFAVRGTLGLTYEGPDLAWETAARFVYARTVLDVVSDRPTPDQADDLVTSSELRINAVRLGLGQSDVRVVPFFRGELDTELTPTSSTAPRQLLLRGSAGLVAYPGPRLREVRLGAVFQSDVADGTDLHRDFGFTFGYLLEWPVVSSLIFSSRLDARWLLADRDDRAADLGLFASFVNKLSLPVLRSVSVFVFADVVLVRGKVPETDVLGGSYILGGGLELSRAFKL
jgi:hypothetical protein